jgi:hypothetical protein
MRSSQGESGRRGSDTLSSRVKSASRQLILCSATSMLMCFKRWEASSGRRVPS